MGEYPSSFFVFLDGALGALLWCVVALAAWWLMFQAPFARRRVKTSVRIAAPAEKIWAAWLAEPSPEGGWGGAVEISAQGFEGEPPTRHRAVIRHGGIGPFRESLWRVVRLTPNELLETEQLSIGGTKVAPGEVSASLRLTPADGGVLVEQETRRLVRGLFGYLYVPGANRRAFEHLRAHCEGRDAAGAAPILSLRAQVALGVAAFAVTAGAISALDPEMWAVAAFVALFLQLAMWIHELGHLLAMRWFGHKDATLMMVPFLGGAAIGAKRSSTRFEKAVVALMGPGLSGLIVLALTPAAGWGLKFLEAGRPAVDWSRPDAIQSAIGICVVAFLAMAIPINIFNLAPVGMLDGGKVVSALASGRASRAFYFVAIFGILGFAVAGSGSEQQIGAALVFVLLAFASTLLTKDSAPDDLAPMTRRQTLATLGMLALTLAVYVDASRTLVPALFEAARTGISGPGGAGEQAPPPTPEG